MNRCIPASHVCKTAGFLLSRQVGHVIKDGFFNAIAERGSETGRHIKMADVKHTQTGTAPAEKGKLMLTGYLFFIVRLIIFTTLFFFPVYLKDMGFSGWQIGLLMGIDSLMTLLTTLPMGVSNDMFPSRMLVASSFGALGITYFALSFSTSFAVLLLLIMCYGTWYNLGQISMRSLFYKTAGADGKGRRFSTIAFAEHMGIAAGALLGGLLLGWLSFPAVFRVCGVLFLLIVPLGLLLPGTLAQIFEPAVYKKEIFRRDVVMFALVTFLYTYHWGAEKTVYVLFLKESLGFSQAGIGIFIGLTVIALALACLIYGRLLDRGTASLRRLIIAGLWLVCGRAYTAGIITDPGAGLDVPHHSRAGGRLFHGFFLCHDLKYVQPRPRGRRLRLHCPGGGARDLCRSAGQRRHHAGAGAPHRHDRCGRAEPCRSVSCQQARLCTRPVPS